MPPAAREVLWTIVALIAAMLLWVPAVAPVSFLRYVVHLVPLAALLLAWVIARAGAAVAAASGHAWARPATVAAGALFLAVSGIASTTVAAVLLSRFELRRHVIRSELTAMLDEVFVPRPDPNRDVIEALAPALRDGDEILVNYEDIPFMFYTRARIRGGVAAFRVEDRTAPPPRFAVLRRSVPFVHWPVFVREVERYWWRPVAGVSVPDIPFGNNPDPSVVPYPPTSRTIVVAERVEP